MAWIKQLFAKPPEEIVDAAMKVVDWLRAQPDHIQAMSIFGLKLETEVTTGQRGVVIAKPVCPECNGLGYEPDNPDPRNKCPACKGVDHEG